MSDEEVAREALEFWRSRLGDLPWWRRSARRECRRSIAFWLREVPKLDSSRAVDQILKGVYSRPDVLVTTNMFSVDPNRAVARPPDWDGHAADVTRARRAIQARLN